MDFKKDIFYRKQQSNSPPLYYFGYVYKDLTIASHLQFPFLVFVFKADPKYKIGVLHNFTQV